MVHRIHLDLSWTKEGKWPIWRPAPVLDRAKPDRYVVVLCTQKSCSQHLKIGSQHHYYKHFLLSSQYCILQASSSFLNIFPINISTSTCPYHLARTNIFHKNPLSNWYSSVVVLFIGTCLLIGKWRLNIL